jgi:alkylation response protein AidB-like acyl-CoA dehydrogenase
MDDYRPPLADIRFVLDNIVGLETVCSWPGFEHVDPDLTYGILQEAGRFAAERIAPLNRPGDVEGAAHHEDGSVTLPAGFREAYASFVIAGWNAVKANVDHGGHGFPSVVGAAVQEMMSSACTAFSLCPMLTQGAVALLDEYGSEEQKATYLENLTSGLWAGTMVLTESQAGSNLGAVRTRAEPEADGSWRIFGTKIFITWGEHDLAENIIHFILARTPDSPPGTKGLSLFIVPKYLPDSEGRPGAHNDLNCMSIEHKIGIHASPTCVMAFGDDNGAIGYLLGKEHQGMKVMFTMMNEARLQVGGQGLAASEQVLQQAGAFAQSRRQGRAAKWSSGGDSPIIDHPDVRRMMLTIRSYTEAMRALLYDNATRYDAERHHPDLQAAKRAGAIARLLTPVSKAWCTDIGVEVASLGIQIHGGMGYVEETGAAQMWRDSRIGPIYEGTNGIQAIDLVMRKLPAGAGTAALAYLDEVALLARTASSAGLAPAAENLAAAHGTLVTATEWLLAAPDPADRLAGASPYLRMFGTVAGGRYLTSGALAAVRLTERDGDPSGFYAAKIATATFYTGQLLPLAHALLPAVTAGAASLENAGASATIVS